MMDGWIYGAGIFALAIIAAFLLLSEHRSAERVGVDSEPDWWASHEFLMAVTAICDYVAICILA